MKFNTHKELSWTWFHYGNTYVTNISYFNKSKTGLDEIDLQHNGDTGGANIINDMC